jgi:hypothetical protein
MKSLRIVDGDIQLSVARRADFVYGKQKLFQDLQLWLFEPFGIGPTSPNFGSYLGSYVGHADLEAAAADIEAEVRRVLSLYQTWQMERLTKARDRRELGYWSRAEILEEIVEVKTKIRHDAVAVRVKLRTLAQAQQSLTIQFDVPTSGLR